MFGILRTDFTGAHPAEVCPCLRNKIKESPVVRGRVHCVGSDCTSFITLSSCLQIFHLATMHKLHASLILHEKNVRNTKACRSELSKLSSEEGSCLPNTSIMPRNGVHEPVQAQARGQECPAEVGQRAHSAQCAHCPQTCKAFGSLLAREALHSARAQTTS